MLTKITKKPLSLTMSSMLRYKHILNRDNVITTKEQRVVRLDEMIDICSKSKIQLEKTKHLTDDEVRFMDI